MQKNPHSFPYKKIYITVNFDSNYIYNLVQHNYKTDYLQTYGDLKMQKKHTLIPIQKNIYITVNFDSNYIYII